MTEIPVLPAVGLFFRVCHFTGDKVSVKNLRFSHISRIILVNFKERNNKKLLNLLEIESLVQTSQ